MADKVIYARMISAEEVLKRLELRAVLAGSLRKAARELGVSTNYLSLILAGRRNPGDALLGRLGLRRRVTRTITYFDTTRRA